MKVEHALAMQAGHELTQQSSAREQLRIWVDRNPPASPKAASRQVAISDAARQERADSKGGARIHR